MFSRMSAIAMSLLFAGASSLAAPPVPTVHNGKSFHPQNGRKPRKSRAYRAPGNKLASKVAEGRLGLIR
jgi:hypothetical protein